MREVCADDAEGDFFMKTELKGTDSGFQTMCFRPLVAGDAEAYVVRIEAGEPAAVRVTARRADGTVLTGTGNVSESGAAEYVLDSEMYAVSGTLVLRISAVRGKEVLTLRELTCTVLPAL